MRKKSALHYTVAYWEDWNLDTDYLTVTNEYAFLGLDRILAEFQLIESLHASANNDIIICLFYQLGNFILSLM